MNIDASKEKKPISDNEEQRFAWLKIRLNEQHLTKHDIETYIQTQ